MAAPSHEDRLAIIDLTIAYCWALDSHDWAALDDVFLADATAELGTPPLEGLAAIKALVAQVLEPLDESQHLVTNHQVVVDQDGQRATCRCYLQAQHVRRGFAGGDNFLLGGRYEDVVVRTEAGWRISARRLVPMWREGNAAVVRPSRSS